MTTLAKVIITLGLLLLPQTILTIETAAKELPEPLYSKGGIIYPRTGDSTQEIFRTPPNVRDFLEEGMLIGVLPTDCMSASRGVIGDYYICHHGLALKPEEHQGKTVYRVIKVE